MNWVAPIRDEETLRRFKEKLREVDDKYYILFEIGAGTGMQVREILKFRNRDVCGADEIEAFIGAKNIRQVFPVPPGLKEIIRAYTEGKDPEGFLIPGNSGAALSREQAYRVLREAGKSVGLASIGAQTMRKTFAWQYYKETGDIYYLQSLLNHASPSVTYRYIGEKPPVEIRLEKLTPEENARSRSDLHRDGNGRKRIQALKALLEELEQGLEDPVKEDGFYGKVDCLLTEMEGLAEAFRSDG